jgi:hypothetical protein
METIQHYRAMLGFCRQRAQMEGESEAFWLEHAATIERMLVTLERMQDHGIGIETAAEAAKEKRPPTGLQAGFSFTDLPLRHSSRSS